MFLIQAACQSNRKDEAAEISSLHSGSRLRSSIADCRLDMCIVAL